MRAQRLQFRPNSLRKTAARSSIGAGAVTISPSLKLITLLMFLPEELSFYIGDFRLSPVRLALLLLTPVFLSVSANRLHPDSVTLFFPTLRLPYWESG